MTPTTPTDVTDTARDDDLWPSKWLFHFWLPWEIVLPFMRKWWTYHQYWENKTTWADLGWVIKTVLSGRGPSCIISQKPLVSQLCSHTQSTQGPRDEFQWHITHPSFRAICCFPRAAPTPPSQYTKTLCAGGALGPNCITGMATAHTAAGKKVPAQRKTWNLGWIKRAAGRGWNLERRRKKRSHPT